MRHLILALLLAASQAFAANTVTLSWIPATTRADGTPLPAATPFFNVYQGSSGQEVKAASGIAVPTYSATGFASASTVCFQITQIEVATGLESARSIEACKTFPPDPTPPNAPTGLTIK